MLLLLVCRSQAVGSMTYAAANRFRPRVQNKLACSMSSANWIYSSILYEDNHLLIVNKPPTLLISSDKSSDPNLLDISKSYIAQKYHKAGEVYLGLVHRLDRPCSGVVAFARTSKAAARLSKAFSERRVDKTYVCIVRGTVLNPGRCNNFLRVSSGNSSNNRVTVISSEETPSRGIRAVEASLVYSPLMTFDSRGEPHTVLEVDLHTGRKHQIRAQLSHIGYSICGDGKYGCPPWQSHQTNLSSEGSTFVYNGRGIMLHAHSLSVPHPVTKNLVTCCAPLPRAWSIHFGENIVKQIENTISLKSQ